jgi:hypothetical protein
MSMLPWREHIRLSQRPQEGEEAAIANLAQANFFFILIKTLFYAIMTYLQKSTHIQIHRHEFLTHSKINCVASIQIKSQKQRVRGLGL